MKLVQCYEITPYHTGYSVIGSEITESNCLVSIACDSIEDVAIAMQALYLHDFDYARIYYNGIEIAMYSLDDDFVCMWRNV